MYAPIYSVVKRSGSTVAQFLYMKIVLYLVGVNINVKLGILKQILAVDCF